MIHITGDTHGDFNEILYLIHTNKLSPKDVVIILGDAGINYYGGKRDENIKKVLQDTGVIFFCIHGNHEKRPQTIDTYKTKKFLSGTVYYEEEYPDILFAKDGEIFDFNGLKTIVIGGAYSVDKAYRLLKGWNWFEDEQPSKEIKEYVEKQLENQNWKIDAVLTHTCPLQFEPIEWFLSFIDQSTVDKSTEEWLDSIKNKLDYKYWFCGHYHGEKKTEEIEFLYHTVKEFPEK